MAQWDRAKKSGISLDWLTFDEGYGACPGFLFGLDDRDRNQLFVGEVPRSFSCTAVHRNGQRPNEDVKGRKAEEVVESCVAFKNQQWQVLRLRRASEEDQVWRVKAARVWLHSAAGWSLKSFWLIWASNDKTGEEKFFLSNAPPDASGDSDDGFQDRSFARYRTALSQFAGFADLQPVASRVTQDQTVLSGWQASLSGESHFSVDQLLLGGS